MNAPTLAALMLVAVAAWSGYTVVNYAERHIWASNDAWVLKVCWGAYVLSWLPIVLLPFEVMNADLTRCSINWTFWSWFRHLGWIVLYWTITVRAVAFTPRATRGAAQFRAPQFSADASPSAAPLAGDGVRRQRLRAVLRLQRRLHVPAEGVALVEVRRRRRRRRRRAAAAARRLRLPPAAAATCR